MPRNKNVSVAIGLSTTLSIVVTPEIAEKFPNPSIQIANSMRYVLRNKGPARKWNDWQNGKYRRIFLPVSRIKGHLPAKRFGSTDAESTSYGTDEHGPFLTIVMPEKKRPIRQQNIRNPTAHLRPGIRVSCQEAVSITARKAVEQRTNVKFGQATNQELRDVPERIKAREPLRRPVLHPPAFEAPFGAQSQNELRISDLGPLVDTINAYREKYGENLELRITESGKLSASLLMSFGEK